MPAGVPLRARVPGAASASVVAFGPAERRVVLARIDPSQRRGALTEEAGFTLADAAHAALDLRLPLVGIISTSGADVHEGMSALHGWGSAARAVAACSGVVPVLMAVVGPAMSGPALLLGMADVVVMSPDALAYVSGPAAVAEVTGLVLRPAELGGVATHARSTGLAALVTDGGDQAEAALADAAVVPSRQHRLPGSRRALRRPPRPNDAGAARPSCRRARRAPTTSVTWRSPSPTTEGCSSCAPGGRRSW